MSEPLRIIIDLSPETIEALASARRPKSYKRLAPSTYPRRAMRHPSPVSMDAVREAIAGKSEIAVRFIAEALGVPDNRATSALVGRALRQLGWAQHHRAGAGERERIYRPLPAPPVPA
jgi:hypothetical protein